LTPGTKAQSLYHAFIALGSNLANPALQVRRAFADLSQLPAGRLLNCSAIYRSAPVGRLDQPDFINAVAQIETALTPHDLLKALLEIECRRGRVRELLNAPRILDLDLLLYADLQCHEPGLTLPHPRMHQRAFVLQPLMEIAPDCCIPGHGAVAGLLAACAGQRIEREQPR
jgi:2-amino-4-hydroxy-6-hydroxymethyldihydropteridine diphosphokinase